MKLSELKQWLDSELSVIIPDATQRTAERNWFILHILGIPAARLFTHPQETINYNADFERLQLVVKQRIVERTPIQYLLGEATFYGLSFQVSPAVLIPRPETELLVEKAIRLCDTQGYQRILDLGTGSGCIPIALKYHRPQLDITAVDISDDALAIAKGNAETHQTEICFKQGSWFEPLNGNSFDLILSNPPYIAPDDAATLAPEVLQEPHLALFTKTSDPIVFYRELIEQTQAHLSANAAFIFEMGLGQAEALAAFCESQGMGAEVLRDYAGHPRLLVGYRGV